MHRETIAPEVGRVLEKISERDFLEDFYLVGGTALAIHLGHRESMDLDFFSEQDFSRDKLKQEVGSIGRY